MGTEGWKGAGPEGGQGGSPPHPARLWEPKVPMMPAPRCSPWSVFGSFCYRDTVGDAQGFLLGLGSASPGVLRGSENDSAQSLTSCSAGTSSPGPAWHPPPAMSARVSPSLPDHNPLLPCPLPGVPVLQVAHPAQSPTGRAGVGLWVYESCRSSSGQYRDSGTSVGVSTNNTNSSRHLWSTED